MEQTTENTMSVTTAEGLTLSGTPEQVMAFLKKQVKQTKAKKTSINGAPMSIVADIVVEDKGEDIAFKHPDYKNRTISKAILELAAEKFEAKGADSTNKTTGTDFVKVGEGNFPVGYNLIQAKNNAGL